MKSKVVGKKTEVTEMGWLGRKVRVASVAEYLFLNPSRAYVNDCSQGTRFQH